MQRILHEKLLDRVYFLSKILIHARITLDLKLLVREFSISGTIESFQSENILIISLEFKSTDFKEYNIIYFHSENFEWFLKLKILELTILEHA